MTNDWIEVAPSHDADGRPLTKTERLQHAKRVLEARDAEWLADFAREQAADPDLTERDVARLVQATKYIMLGARCQRLSTLSASLPDDDPAAGVVH